MTPARLAYLLSLDSYPALRVIESHIAREWIRKHGAEYDDIDFDVQLGQGVQLGPGFDQTTRDQAVRLSQKRADFVARRGTAVNIVEVKRRIDFAPMGQLIGYSTLWRIDHTETTDLKLTAIGWDALLDAVEVLHAHGIDVETFPNLIVLTPPKATG